LKTAKKFVERENVITEAGIWPGLWP